MAIVNLRLNKVSGERKEASPKNVTANANSSITSVKKLSDKKLGDYLLVNFEYKVSYEPDLGSLELVGSLWYMDPKLGDMVKDGKEDVELKKEAVVEITNAVIRDSLIESIDLARKLQLPPPIQLPRVEVKPDQLKFKKAS